jgi:predicted DNA-binding protein YlxM (UPF0122 family)
LNGQEIADELKVTRQNVSNTLKRGMKKVYQQTCEIFTGVSPYEAVLIISKKLQVEDHDLINFLKLFPKDIKKEIEESAKKYQKGCLLYVQDDVQ